MIQNYYLGGPVWANKDWIGYVFPRQTPVNALLYEYAKIFNTVEGSTTFYHLPTAAAVQRWNEDTPPQFRFSFKFPSNITHVQHLRNAQRETKLFLQTISPLLPKIGNLFLQLPPSFDHTALDSLRHYLQTLPNDFVYTVEVRHLDFYANNDATHRLNDMLQALNINRAIFDTTELHRQQSNDPEVLEAQRKKPRMPEYFIATAKQPFLRYVGHQTAEANRSRLDTIAAQVAQWLEQGCIPFVYFHTPNDLQALHLARLFHELLRTKTQLDIGIVPPFGGEHTSMPSLFD